MKKSQLSPVRALAAAALVATAALRSTPAAAQSADPAPARPQGAPQVVVDSAAFERARQLVLGGHNVAGRALADSLVQAATPGTDAYGEALYWRATLSPTAADAERDYRRIIIEYALAPHAGDALLALAQLEMSRGDRMAAVSHLDRFLLEYPQRTERPRAGLWLGRLLFEQGNASKACAVLADAKAAVPAGQVELANQIDYYATRCVGVDTAPAPVPAPVPTAIAKAPAAQPAAKTPVADAPASLKGAAPAPAAAAKPASSAAAGAPPGVTAARPTSSENAGAPRAAEDVAAAKPARRPMPERVARDSGARVRRPHAARSGPWTVQVAAYQTEREADALVARLRTREYDAYVARATRVYRVRVGHFATREEALSLLRSMRQGGAFVTKTQPPVR